MVPHAGHLELRQQVHNIWRRYHSGELSFITAAKLTATAFYLVRGFIEALDDSCFLAYESIMALLELGLQQVDGQLHEFSSGNDERANSPEAGEFSALQPGVFSRTCSNLVARLVGSLCYSNNSITMDIHSPQ